MTQFHKRGLFDIRDTTIEYCETSNDVKTCREYTGKILGEYFYDIANRPFYGGCGVSGSAVDNLLRCNIQDGSKKTVCVGEDWHIFNFEDAYLWRDNLSEIITDNSLVVLEWDRQYDFEVATGYSQNRHYKVADNMNLLRYKCVLKL